jgi:hypothetical protein
MSASVFNEGSRPYSTVIAERKDSCSRRGKVIVDVDADYLPLGGGERIFLGLALAKSLENPREGVSISYPK